MGVYDVVFLALAALTVLSACVVAGSRNIVYSGFALIFTFLGVAGLYVQLAADFLAAMQVLVYVGGITVVILFAVMLTRDIAEAANTNPILNRPASLLAAAGVFMMSLVLILGSDWPLRAELSYTPMSAPLGRALLGKYLLPFEVASLLLLGALIGAVIIARREVRGGQGATGSKDAAADAGGAG
ncbi:MAG: NADH-quinone oxidoreductase subunit J [Gemmatimonadales bacterium]|nr:MAG: NADH-quinone oxidoreductase subunit J [Gemmatimonadales bacterium]